MRGGYHRAGIDIKDLSQIRYSSGGKYPQRDDISAGGAKTGNERCLDHIAGDTCVLTQHHTGAFTAFPTQHGGCGTRNA